MVIPKFVEDLLILVKDNPELLPLVEDLVQDIITSPDKEHAIRAAKAAVAKELIRS